jgi:hypothetical protein
MKRRVPAMDSAGWWRPAPWLLALIVMLIVSAVWVLAVVLWLRLEDPDQALPWGYNRLGFSQRASESVVDTILPSDFLLPSTHIWMENF